MTSDLKRILSTPNLSSPTNPLIPVSELDPEALETLKMMDELVKKQPKEISPPTTPRALTGRALALTSPSSPEKESLPTTPVKTESKFLALSPASEESPDSTPEKTPPRKSKFFAADSSSDNTPESTPEKKIAVSPGSALMPQTPTDLKIAKGIIGTNDPKFNLMPKDRQRLEKGLKCLNELKSPQHSQQVAAVRTLVTQALGRNSPVLEVRSPLAPRNLMLAIENCADESWITPTLKPSGTLLLDRTHHTRFINGSGKHICPIGDPLDNRILKRRINLDTGIWCGMITTANQEEKFSSFIPRTMTEEKYYALLQKTLANENFCIARAENKGLYTVHGEGFHFCIEVYSREEGTMIRSAFPIFHHESYNGKQKTLKIEIGHKWSIEEKDPVVRLPYEISYKVILDHAKALKEGAEAIQYETDSTLIVDVNLLVGSNPNYSCPIPRGVLVSIPKRFIP